MTFPQADTAGNTYVGYRSDGILYLKFGEKQIIPSFAGIPLFQEMDRAGFVSVKAESKEGRFYLAFEEASAANPGGAWSFFVFRNDGTLEEDKLAWKQFISPFRVLDAVNAAGEPFETQTGWNQYTWRTSELGDRFQWILNPSSTSDISTQTALTGTAKKADILTLTGTPEFGAATADRITNFNPKEKDKLQIDVSDFGSNAAGTFKIAKNSKALNKVLASTTDFIYLKSTGELYYNENGKLSGFGDGGVFAILENKANITTKNVEFL